MSLKKSSLRICVTREQIPLDGSTTFAAVDRRYRCLQFGERGREGFVPLTNASALHGRERKFDHWMQGSRRNEDAEDDDRVDSRSPPHDAGRGEGGINVIPDHRAGATQMRIVAASPVRVCLRLENSVSWRAALDDWRRHSRRARRLQRRRSAPFGLRAKWSRGRDRRFHLAIFFAGDFTASVPLIQDIERLLARRRAVGSMYTVRISPIPDARKHEDHDPEPENHPQPEYQSFQ